MADEPPVSPETPTPTPEKKSHTGLIITIVLIVIVVLLALFFGLYFGLRNNEPDTPDEINPDPDIVEPGPVDPDSTGDDGEPSHTEHSWVWEHDDGGHWQVCEVCGETTTKEDHELTYTEKDSTYHLVTCDICGDETTIEHTFDGYISDGENGHYQKCTECEYTTSDENHEYTSVVTSPTCTEGGYTTYTCACGYSYTGDKTNALGHNWGNWTDNGNDETHIRTCSRCNNTETKEHDYEVTNITDINLSDVTSGQATATYEYTCTECEHTKTEANQPYTLNFATDSWEIIDEVSAAGYASTYYSIGDTKTITIGIEAEEYQEHEIRIIDFDHDDLTNTEDNGYDDSNYNGGTNKAGITCDMVDCLSTIQKWNTSKTDTSGGWYGCDMRSYLNSDEGCVLSTLDEDLQSVIKKVDKKSTAGKKSTSLGTTASDSLFLLAEVELDGTTTAGYVNEGTQYAYWSETTTSTDRIKTVKGTGNMWWLRSPKTTDSSYVCVVDPYGYNLDYYCGNEYGVSFAFCV